MLPIRNISYLSPICCNFWGKYINSHKIGQGCSTPLTSLSSVKWVGFRLGLQILTSSQNVAQNAFLGLSRSLDSLKHVEGFTCTMFFFFFFQDTPYMLLEKKNNDSNQTNTAYNYVFHDLFNSFGVISTIK